jgi:hypothetical protein
MARKTVDVGEETVRAWETATDGDTRYRRESCSVNRGKL